MAKSAPVGTDFHEDKIESRPSRPDRHQQKIGVGTQAGSPESVTDPAPQPLNTAKARKAGKKR
jgi:hypothetical protein